MRIHQLVHTLNYGDAISGEALTIRSLLQGRGFDSKIFCLHAHPKVKQFQDRAVGLQAELDSAQAAGDKIVLILHYSIGSPLNDMYLQAPPGVVKTIIYHNLTPAKWYLGYNERVATDLIRGREELPHLISSSDIVLADSEYNRSELAAFHHGETALLPLPLDSTKWGIEANAGIREILSRPVPLVAKDDGAPIPGAGRKTVNILHVGRTAPNKRLEDIIKVFYFYHHKINRSSRLWLIGSDIDNEIYSFELRRLVSELVLKEAVTFVGSVADSELRAFYETSDVYLCMSEHEGFCVPILEALNFNLPVIAYAACAVPETIGDAGILVDHKRHAEIAELVEIVVTDEALRTDLQLRGRKQVQQFNEQRFLNCFEQTVIEPAARLSSAKEPAAGRRAQ
jgi:glycosyltransferase involved in cell wall biosynthesis